MRHKRHTAVLFMLTIILNTLVFSLSAATSCRAVQAITPDPAPSATIPASPIKTTAPPTKTLALPTGIPAPPTATTLPVEAATAGPASAAESSPSANAATITLDINTAPTAIDTRILGTNLPAWLGTSRTENSTFIGRTLAASPTLIRIPGGSWSNGYDWLACETGTDIEGNATCWSWPWGLRPTDFINFIQTIGGKAMYTINLNGTAKEAAALVAFFNGAVTDNTVIGVDVRGRDWGKVKDWAQMRSNNGNPDPLNIKYWEIGNEIFGGKSGMGTDCVSGWEDVWTCDGAEYVNGIGSGVNRKEGYIAFRDAMRAVDSTIMVGAVGVTPQDSWTNWGNEVIAAAGNVMDFYIIHQYAYFNQPANFQAALAQPQAVWQPIMADIAAALDLHAGGRRVPIAVTEHNLFSVQDQDNNQWMTRAVNMLFMADSIGQMMEHGFAMANQWDLANGQAGNGTDYGLLDADTFARSPQYYVFPLWARFGQQMLPVTTSYDPATTLSVYAGMPDGETASLLAINKTGNSITANIQINGVTSFAGGTADVVQATSLDSQTVTFNGVSNPSDDLSNAPPAALTNLSNPLSYTFQPYSVTLLRLNIGTASSQLTVDDVTVTEGDSGVTDAIFTVSLSPASSQTVTVDYATADDLANAGSDYTAVNGTLTFNPGVTSRTVSVVVNGDTFFEGNETFNFILSNVNLGALLDAIGIGQILDDDAVAWVYLPSVSRN